MTETAMTPPERDIIELVDMIWSTTLGFAIHAVDAADRREWTLPAVEAQVHIAGTWQGVVVLHTSQALAARVAQRMFDLGSAPPSAEDMQDAFGEVANITGGNIKGLLSEGDAHLSLPAVFQGFDYSVRVPGSRQVARVEFICDGEPLVVTVLHAEATRAAGADAHNRPQAVHAS
jgi:chemotaxis protein CheX